MVWNHWFLWSLNFSPLIYGFLGQFLPWHRTLRRILTELGCHLGRSGSIPFSTSHKKWGEQINIPGHQSKSMETHKVYGGEKSTSTCWKTVALLFSAVFKGLGCWTCRQWFSWYKKLRLSIHIIVKAGDFGSRDHGGCAPGDSMIDTAALCGKGRIWS